MKSIVCHVNQRVIEEPIHNFSSLEIIGLAILVALHDGTERVPVVGAMRPFHSLTEFSWQRQIIPDHLIRITILEAMIIYR
jgi:hypothetical protein